MSGVLRRAIISLAKASELTLPQPSDVLEQPWSAIVCWARKAAALKRMTGTDRIVLGEELDVNIRLWVVFQ